MFLLQKLPAQDREERRQRVLAPEHPQRDGDVRQNGEHDGRNHPGAVQADGPQGGRRERPLAGREPEEARQKGDGAGPVERHRPVRDLQHAEQRQGRPAVGRREHERRGTDGQRRRRERGARQEGSRASAVHGVGHIDQLVGFDDIRFGVGCGKHQRERLRD